MQSIFKVQIEDESGNIHYPHTTADIVFMADDTNVQQTVTEIREQMDRYANISMSGETLHLPGSGNISVRGEILTLPLGL